MLTLVQFKHRQTLYDKWSAYFLRTFYLATTLANVNNFNTLIGRGICIKRGEISVKLFLQHSSIQISVKIAIGYKSDKNPLFVSELTRHFNTIKKGRLKN